MRSGEALVTDGPYAEVKESLGGYYLFSCDSIEEAIAWAAKIPAAWHGGAIEVRPVHVGRGGSGMKYAMLVYSDQSAWEGISEEEAARLRAESMPRWIALFEEMGKADPNVQGRELADASEGKGRPRRRRSRRSSRTARSPRRRSSSAASSCTELPDLDEAIRLAALVPAAEYGTLEIRPLATR